ncbi:MAG: HAD hydrolase-like protein [Rhodobacteraceae bacterium]|nr:HAD hydrolase-like protein [Paracoccaceae bacterium]
MGFGKSTRGDYLTAPAFRTTDFQTAFAKYEAVRDRMPSATESRETVFAENLEVIADQFDAVLLDAFGVLNIGETVLPGAPERIAALRRLGKNVRVLTNAASVPPIELLKKYNCLGFNFTLEEVISSRQVLLAKADKMQGVHWGVILPEGSDMSDLGGLSFECLKGDEQAYRSVDGFLFLGSAGWRDAQQSLFCAEVKRKPRPVWIGNPDIVAPREYGFTIEPGFFAHGLADSTGIIPEFFGKPFGNAFEMALRSLPGQPDLNRVLMVGDSLHTDVLGGNAAGVRTALLPGYGFLAGQDFQVAIDQANIHPDFVIRRI